MKLAVRLAAAAVALAAVSAPLHSQTGNTWQNQKMFDMKSHSRNQDFDSRATSHYEMAVSEAGTIQDLVGVEERSKRQEKRLQKAYGRAVEHLEEAIEVAPDFVGARLMLGAIHYKMKAYEAARDAYEGVLEVDPENQDARAYLDTVNWYLQRAAGEGTAQAADSGG